MKPFVISLCLSLLTLPAFSQPTDARGNYYTDSKEIGETVMNWIKVLQYKQAAQPYIKNGWKYTADQIAFTHQLINWWQGSYTPTGVLGDMNQSVLAPPLSNYEKGSWRQLSDDARFALPNTYGAFARLHRCVSKTATVRFTPTPGNWCHANWNIMANNVELISNQVAALSTAKDYYFTMPVYTLGQSGEFDTHWMPQHVNYRDFPNSANLKKYTHYFRPDTRSYIIVMTKDDKPLPFEQVTVGEFLNQVEAQFPVIHKMNADSKVPTLLQDAKKGFQLIKEKYKDRHNEYVYFREPNKQKIDLYDFQYIEEYIKKGQEIKLFYTQAVSETTIGGTINKYTNYPLLRLKKGVKEACATSGPQWIIFSLTAPTDLGYNGSVDLMDHFVKRFNYDYVYQYFFGDKKPAGAYSALSTGSADNKKSQSATAPSSDAAKAMAADKNVLFFEDFSTVVTGATPGQWNTERSTTTGDPVTVTEIEGTSGKWLKLKGNASPKNTKLSLSGDYTISFDILVHKGDVPWGTPGIELRLYNESSSHKYTIDVSPGNMNTKDAAGWVMINQNMPQDYGKCKQESYYSLPDFTGSKNTNQVTMAIQKKGEKMTILCNNRVVYECSKAIPADMAFKNFSFYVNQKNVYYISNVLIKR